MDFFLVRISPDKKETFEKKITFEENEVGDSNCTLFIQNICMNELINDEEVS